MRSSWAPVAEAVRDPTDRKSREVVIAWYAFRHEAEFAAGFLDDAGIPYRMQFDDPILGSGVSSNARIWVRGIDERRAREVLELDDRPAYLSGGSSERRRSSAPRRPDRPSPASAWRSARPARSDAEGVPSWELPALSVRERGLALLGAGGVLALMRLFPGQGIDPIVGGGAVTVAALLAVAGIAGWAPGPLRRLLRALSGGAP